MQDKNCRTPETEKGFSLLRTDTIQLWVWLQGYQSLEDQPLKSLSEDISYRIRETTDVYLINYLLILDNFLIPLFFKCAVNFMRHCKRSKLKTSDLNKTFQLCNIEVKMFLRLIFLKDFSLFLITENIRVFK